MRPDRAIAVVPWTRREACSQTVQSGKVEEMMSLRKKALATAVAAGALALRGICSAQTCGGGPSIAIAKTADLNFGSLIATGSAGTAVINATTGARTVSGGVVAAGGAFGLAGFSVILCGSGGPKRFDIILPSAAVTLNGSGGGTMTVDTFTSNPTGPRIPSDTNPPPTPFAVGATLHVGASQTQGTYTGTFNVTVARQ
jgi:uncharacterized protein DUF4402